MFGRNALFVLYSIMFVVFAQQITKNADNYGPYRMEFHNYSVCKGPMAKNLSNFSSRLAEDGKGEFNLTAFADTKLDEMRIRVHNIKDNKKNFLWSYKLTDPCKHFSIALIIQQSLKADKCIIKKGFYTNQLNMNDVVISFLGPSFFFGKYTSRAELSSKKGNIACATFTWVINKKT